MSSPSPTTEQTAGSASAGETQLLGARPGSAAAIDGETSVWSSADGRDSVLLRTQLVPAVEACGVFRTREEHVDELTATLSLSRPTAGALLGELAAAGIVVEPSWFVPRGQAAAEQELPDPLIAIRTYRRPGGLARLLASLLEDERRHGVRRRYLVLDDDSDAANEPLARDLAAAFARESRSEVRFFGESARAALMPELLSGHDEAARTTLAQLLTRALPSATGGRVWNWALLFSAGGALSLLDDDLAFPVRRFAQSDDTLELLDTIGSRVRVFDSIEQIDEPEFGGDPFAYAQRLCGRSSSALIARFGWDPNDLHGRNVSQLAFLRARSRVVAAFTGNYGAYAWDTTVYFASPKRDNLADFWREPYRHQRLNADMVTYGVLRPRLTSHASYTPFMVDCREMLPFTGTLGRGDDALFLGLVAACDPNANFAYLPLLTGHFPVEPRDRLARSLLPLLHDVCAFAADQVQWYADGLRSEARRVRLAAIGSGCADLAGAADAAITEAVARWRHANLTFCIERNSEALRLGADAPREWREHVQAMIEANSSARARDPFEQCPLALHRHALLQIAHGARAWPALWDRARDDRGLLDRAAPVLPR